MASWALYVASFAVTAVVLVQCTFLILADVVLAASYISLIDRYADDVDGTKLCCTAILFYNAQEEIRRCESLSKLYRFLKC